MKVVHHLTKNVYSKKEHIFCKNIIPCGFYGDESKHCRIWGSQNVLYIIYCIFQMSKQLFSISDALEYIEKFDGQLLEDIDVIDAVELPPNKIQFCQ